MSIPLDKGDFPAIIKTAFLIRRFENAVLMRKVDERWQAGLKDLTKKFLPARKKNF